MRPTLVTPAGSAEQAWHTWRDRAEELAERALVEALFAGPIAPVPLIGQIGDRLTPEGGGDVPTAAVWRQEAYSLSNSRSRLVCDRLTGISVAFSSFILRM